MSMAIQSGKDQVVIAVDPHKASWTAAAVDSSLQPLASIRVPVSRDGYQALRRFARQWPIAGWAIEGAAGVGAPLTTRLRADGIEVIDVPAKLAARVRVLSIGHGRKNDDADALSVGIAALTSPALSTAQTDAANLGLARHRRSPRRPGEDPHPDHQPTACRAHQADSGWCQAPPERRSCRRTPARRPTPRPRRQDATCPCDGSGQRGAPARSPDH